MTFNFNNIFWRIIGLLLLLFFRALSTMYYCDRRVRELCYATTLWKSSASCVDKSGNTLNSTDTRYAEEFDEMLILLLAIITFNISKELKIPKKIRSYSPFLLLLAKNSWRELSSLNGFIP